MVGFGGYPTVPPVLGASLAGVKTLIHEQNAVIGRANRFLARRADVIATGFAEVGGLSAALQAKCRQVGNPVRPAVIEAASLYAGLGAGALDLLVFGGSQGARIFADVVPPAPSPLLSPQERSAPACWSSRSNAALGGSRPRAPRAPMRAARRQVADLAPFFPDHRWAGWPPPHLVIGRAGASTIAELTVNRAGRPAVLVPLPGSAIDDHQACQRTPHWSEADAAFASYPQPAFTPRSAGRTSWSVLLGVPARLVSAWPQTAKSALARPHAAARTRPARVLATRPPLTTIPRPT